MTSTVLVTGATGLIGSNVCELLIEKGFAARALVRPGSVTEILETMGVQIVAGDVTTPDEVAQAAEGCDYCIHSAALVVGGPPHSYEDYLAVNGAGTKNVLDAAERHGIRRTVALSTSAVFSRAETLSESSAVREDRGEGDPYGATKLVAYEDSMQRVADGLDVVTVLPGACYGPAPTLARAVEAPGFNSRVVLALQGKIDEFPVGPLSFVLARDVATACITALSAGRAGEKYLAWGRPEEVSNGVELYNRALEVAGSDKRVRALTAEDLERPEVLERWGPAVLRTAKAKHAEPYFSNALTVERLGYAPASFQETVETTVRWMLDHRLTV